MHPFATMAVIVGLAVTPEAAAAEAAPAPVSFSHSREAFRPWSIDTGWMPETGAIQVRFVGYVGGGMRCSASGAVHLSWPSPQLWAEGQADAGLLNMDLGVELQTFLRLNLQVFDQRYSWEGPIPLLPGFDYRFAGSQTFTPFLMSGQEPGQVVVSDSIQQTELFSLSLTDAIVPIPGISGSIDVTAGGLLDLVMQGQRLSFPEGDLTQQGGTLPVELPAGAHYQTTARYDANVTYQGALDLQPAVVVHLGPFDWDLARFPISVPLGAVSETWSFAAQTAAFDLPRLQASVDGVALFTGAALPFGSDPSRTVRISNTGLAVLTGTLRVSGEGFTLLGDGAIRLAPGESAGFQIDSSRMTSTGMMTVDTGDPAGPLVAGLSSTAPPPPPPDPDPAPAPAPAPQPEPQPDPAPEAPAGQVGCSAVAGSSPLLLLALLATMLGGRRRRQR